MPADSGVIVFGKQHVLNLVRLQIRELRGSLPERQDEIRKWLGLLQPLIVVIVAPTETFYAPFAEEAVELEFLERQRANVVNQ